MPDLIVIRLRPVNPLVVMMGRVQTAFAISYTPDRENLGLFAWANANNALNSRRIRNV